MTHLRGRKPPLSTDRDPLTKAPASPRHLSAQAQAEWKRIIPRLIEDRIITRADLGGIEDLCIARGRIREIEELIQAADGPIDKSLFGMQNRAMQTARQLAAEYGLSPTSRARVQAHKANDNDDDDPLKVT